jgi:colanic acid/amylovoran biosynthesis glycosyltransferase
MKILLCTNVFEVVENGPVKFAHLLLRVNDLYPGHEVRILTEDIQQPQPFVHPVGMPVRWKRSLLSQFARMWLYHQAAMRLRKEYPFDILVYNNALVGFWSAHRYGNTVAMINDDNNLAASWRQFRLTLPAVKRIVFRTFEKLTARRARAVIVNSDYLREAVQLAYGISPSRLHRLYKAVELPGVQTYSLPGEMASPIRVFFVKNDYRRGGLFTLVEALARLPYRFILTVAGPELSQRGEILRSIGRHSNLEGVFLGKISQAAIVEELAKTHIFCVPSHREALGIANLEAMAQGVPVVSTSVGGIPEVLGYGQCGWMAPPQDAAALAEALLECITRPDKRALKIAEAHTRVRHFAPKIMFENFLTILSR